MHGPKREFKNTPSWETNDSDFDLTIIIRNVKARILNFETSLKNHFQFINKLSTGDSILTSCTTITSDCQLIFARSISHFKRLINSVPTIALPVPEIYT